MANVLQNAGKGSARAVHFGPMDGRPRQMVSIIYGFLAARLGEIKIVGEWKTEPFLLVEVRKGGWKFGSQVLQEQGAECHF